MESFDGAHSLKGALDGSKFSCAVVLLQELYQWRFSADRGHPLHCGLFRVRLADRKLRGNPGLRNGQSFTRGYKSARNVREIFNAKPEAKTEERRKEREQETASYAQQG